MLSPVLALSLCLLSVCICKHLTSELKCLLVLPNGLTITPINGQPPWANQVWYWVWVSRSRREGSGVKEGWLWYHPTTCSPRVCMASHAWACDTGSMSHCIPVLTLRHGCTSLTCNTESVEWNWPPIKPITSVLDRCEWTSIVTRADASISTLNGSSEFWNILQGTKVKGSEFALRFLTVTCGTACEPLPCCIVTPSRSFSFIQFPLLPRTRRFRDGMGSDLERRAALSSLCLERFLNGFGSLLQLYWANSQLKLIAPFCSRYAWMRPIQFTSPQFFKPSLTAVLYKYLGLQDFQQSLI